MKVSTAMVVLAACSSGEGTTDTPAVVYPFLPSASQCNSMSVGTPSSATLPWADVEVKIPGYSYELFFGVLWGGGYPDKAVVTLVDDATQQSDSFLISPWELAIDGWEWGRFSIEVADDAPPDERCWGGPYPSGARVRVEVYVHDRASGQLGEIDLGPAT